MRVSLIFAWYYMWVGLYWDRAGRVLYLLPVPCIGLKIGFKKPHSRRILDAAPINITGGEDSVEYVRKIREGE